MKKYIPYVIIVLLLIVIGVGTTYIIMESKNNNESSTQTNTKNNNTNTDTKDAIKLSENELKEYLSYVPNNPYYDEDIFGEVVTYNAYNYDKITIDQIDSKYLLGNILSRFVIIDKEGKENNITSITEVQNLMKKQYNKELNKNFFINSYDSDGKWLNYIASYNGACFTYMNGMFQFSYCAGGAELIDVIDNYSVNKDELIIYNYAVIYSGFNDDKDIFDMHLKKNITINSNDILDDTKISNYIINHKEQFTKYKHTFKKNDTGYYWYSTEIVK